MSSVHARLSDIKCNVLLLAAASRVESKCVPCTPTLSPGLETGEVEDKLSYATTTDACDRMIYGCGSQEPVLFQSKPWR